MGALQRNLKLKIRKESKVEDMIDTKHGIL
jgi:hypothetical protein